MIKPQSIIKTLAVWIMLAGMLSGCSHAIDAPPATIEPSATLQPSATATATPFTPTPTLAATAYPTQTNTPAIFAMCSEPPVLEASQMVVGFEADWDGDREIYTIQADGSGLKQITDNDVDDIYPEWSSDGNSIAFLRRISEGSERVYSLFVVGSDGSNEKLVTPADLNVLPGIAWSPDSQQIAFGGVLSDGSVGLYMTNMEDASLTTLFSDRNYYIDVGDPTWASNGKTIAVMVSDDPRLIIWRVFTVNSDGTNLQTIKPVGLADTLPAWQPDGDRILLVSLLELNTGPAQLSTINPDGTDRKQLTYDELDKFGAEWSPDGQNIVYVATNSHIDPQSSDSINLLSGDGAYDVAILESKQDIGGRLQWAPDTRHILFTLSEGGGRDLYYLDICDGSTNLIVENIETGTWLP